MNEPWYDFNPPSEGFDPNNPIHLAVRDMALAEIEAANLIRDYMAVR